MWLCISPAFPLQRHQSSAAAEARGVRGGMLRAAGATPRAALCPCLHCALGCKLSSLSCIACGGGSRCLLTPRLLSHQQASPLANPEALEVFQTTGKMLMLGRKPGVWLAHPGTAVFLLKQICGVIQT